MLALLVHCLLVHVPFMKRGLCMNRTMDLVLSSVGVLAIAFGGSIADGAEPGMVCAVEHEAGSLEIESRGSFEGFARGGGVCQGCAIEVHVVVDKALFDIHGSETQGFVDDVIAEMDAVWSQPFADGGLGLGVVLVDTTIFFGGDPWATTTDPFGLIGELNDFAELNFPTSADGRDTVLLLTGLDLNAATIGVGTVGTLTRARSAAVAQAAPFSVEAVAAIASHQLGHNAGASHDGATGSNTCPTTEFFMGSISTNSPPTSFSSCSISSMMGYIFNPSFDVAAGLAFGGDVCDADVNGDGVLNFFDISAFIQAFTAGCP